MNVNVYDKSGKLLEGEELKAHRELTNVITSELNMKETNEQEEEAEQDLFSIVPHKKKGKRKNKTPEKKKAAKVPK